MHSILFASILGLSPVFASDQARLESQVRDLSVSLKDLDERQKVLMKDLSGEVELDRNTTFQQIFRNHCGEKKYELINSRYLFGTASATFVDHKWNTAKLHRDTFRANTAADKVDIAPSCLYALHKLAVEELGHKALLAGKECFDAKRDKNIAGLRAAKRPDGCAPEKWRDVQDFGQIVYELEDSIRLNGTDLREVVKVAGNLAQQKIADCLDCKIEATAIRENCVNCSPKTPIHDIAETIEEMNLVTCCNQLIADKMAETKEDCQQQIDPKEPVTKGAFGRCLTQAIHGLTSAWNSLNVVEMAQNLPNAIEILSQLAFEPNRGRTLMIIMLGLMKGFTGYDLKTVQCLNAKGKLAMGCRMLAQGGMTGILAFGVVKVTKFIASQLTGAYKGASVIIADPQFATIGAKAAEAIKRLHETAQKLGIDLRAIGQKFGQPVREFMANKFSQGIDPAMAKITQQLGTQGAELSGSIQGLAQASSQTIAGTAGPGTMASAADNVIQALEATQRAANKALGMKLLGTAKAVVKTGAPTLPSATNPLGIHQRRIEEAK